ncbi:MAG: hypothetical protein JRF33_25295 [Deltaproteobacteria bacterium]|nr:hypothetical protein [Deltaproteobacteria bacterium]
MKNVALVILVAFVAIACSSPLDEENYLCQANEDCQSGFACNAAGACVLADALAITTDSLEPGNPGDSYDNDGANMEASGGLGTLTWTLSAGPSWLSLSETGVFSSTDTETVIGDYPVTVGITDESNRGNGQLVERVYTLSIVTCSGEGKCWIGNEDACAAGMRACIDGEFGECQVGMPLVFSNEFEYCGPDCDTCNDMITDRCEEGICRCGAGGAACSGDLNCCTRTEVGTCVNLNSDTEYCGGCGINCSDPALHTVGGTCQLGVCDYGSCVDGWHDCDGDRGNGCEVQQGLANCGFCGDDCTAGPNAPPGTCNEETDSCDYVCEGHFADCDSAVLGCETDLTEPATCGDCPGGNVTDCTAFDPDLVCLYDSVNTEYYCGCDVGLNIQGDINPDSNVNCGGDQICCEIEGRGTCVEHDAEHCHACGSTCAPWLGGLLCRETEESSGDWDCYCRDLDGTGTNESCQSYPFSYEICGINPDTCFCGLADACQPTEACCPDGGPTFACADLSDDENHCGICGAECASGICGGSEQDDEDGACHCSVDDACPSPSGAPYCGNNDICTCTRYGAVSSPKACPVGMYCMDSGCCTDETETNCCGNGNIWCPDGTCAAPGECPP